MQPLQTAYCTLKAGPKFSLRLSPTLIFSQVLAAITKTALWAAKIATDGAFHGMAVQVTDMRGLTRLGFVDHAILTDVLANLHCISIISLRDGITKVGANQMVASTPIDVEVAR